MNKKKRDMLGDILFPRPDFNKKVVLGKKHYEEINFLIGDSVEDAVNKLLKYKEEGILVCGEFNGTILYSDTVTMDDAYQEIMGQTKEEWELTAAKRKLHYDLQEIEHRAKIPELIKEWSNKGRVILSEDKWERWDEIVPTRLQDLYHGMELRATLDIIQILNNKGTLYEAKEKIESQGHSGMSFSLVCWMVNEFCERGNEFVAYVK